MDVKIAATPLHMAKVGLLAVPLFEEDLGRKAPAHLAALDGKLRGHLRTAARDEGFTGKAGQTFSLHTHGRVPASRVLLVGMGKRKKHDLESLRAAAGTVARTASRTRADRLALALPGAGAEADEVRAVTEGLLLGAYRFDRWRSKDDDHRVQVKSALLVGPDARKKDPAIAKALELGRSVAEAVNWARDLVNEPAMTLTPEALANAAREACEQAGCQVTVWDRKKIEQLEMGMFLGVAQGSQQQPRFIQVRYEPKGVRGGEKAAPLALVGKAITFDSGGLSLKPADAMVDMKTDMAGSAAVFAAMRVIGSVLKPSFPVVAYVGSCENMPSGTAYRPGDILRSRSGKTVEITNTDAEGRLVLGDVLTYAAEQKPRGIVDLATLTGACIVALGNHTVGAFGADEDFTAEVLGAAKQAGEDFWRLPLTPEVKDNLKSDVADMKNSGTRWGGAISAALFLEEFVGDTPWVHLDIAGPSTSDKERGYVAKGGTGVGVRSLVELVRRLDTPAS